MKKIWLYAFCLMILTVSAQATTISLDPVSQGIDVNGFASVNLKISGLGDNTLGNFDFNLNFNPTFIGFESITFGTMLGAGADEWFDDSTAGALFIYDVSMLFPDELITLQTDDNFILATITFKGLSAGVSALNISDLVLGDGYANPMNADIIGASITVNREQQQSPVPEPSTMLLLGFGIVGLAGVARRKMKK